MYSPRNEAIDEDSIYVITRTGKKELLDTNKITHRLQQLARRAPKIEHVRCAELMLKVSQGLKSGITTYEIDEYAANAAASMSVNNPYYLQLAARIAIDNHQKHTHRSFIDKMRLAYLRRDHSGRIVPLLSESFFKYVEESQNAIEQIIDYNRDFLLDFFGFKTFLRLFAIKINGEPIERPQDMFMRVAISIHMNTHLYDGEEGLLAELELIKETYNALSMKWYTHASPTCFNSGAVKSQYASCFLLGVDDSTESIMDTAKHLAKISKWGGGLGVHVNSIRGTNALIRGTNGLSNGLIPFIQIYNAVVGAFNQGGKREGACAIYIMPHHPDIEAFLGLRLPSGIDETKARKLFYALWIPDLFMHRVKDEQLWSLFDPDVCGDLSNLYDTKDNKAYTNAYLELEKDKKYIKQIPARMLWEKLIEANQLIGMPYICFSDIVNRYSMQSNIGVIKSSNLCTEIMEYSDHEQTAVCNLCSINLTDCVKDSHVDEKDTHVLNHDFPTVPVFDFDQLRKTTRMAVVNLNNIIDKNYYPTKEAYRSNMRHRPIGIGIQGLANVFAKMRYPFESPEAAKLNKLIAESIYYAALTESTRLARQEYQMLVKKCNAEGKVTVHMFNEKFDEITKPIIVTTDKTAEEYDVIYDNPNDIPKTAAAYPSMLWNGGSHISKGTFHWELYDAKPSDMYDWQSLREHILTYGVKNSLLVAYMPTASVSQLLGNNECFEPYTSNIYKRKTLAGEFIVLNKYLMHDLYRLNLWTPEIKDFIIALEGSIQNIDGIPSELKQLYKTAWEINPYTLLQLAADRQPYVDQAQSLNWFSDHFTRKEFTNLAFHAWKLQLKTAKYYLHSRPALPAQKFSIDHKLQQEMAELLEKERHNRSTAFMDSKKDICDVCSV